MAFLRHWKHKNILLFLLGILIAFLFSGSLRQLLPNLGQFGYIGAFMAGVLFVSTFTIATGALMLLTLAGTLVPLEIITLAALGAVTGDLLIFKFIRNEVTEEITPIYNNLTGSHLKKILHTKYFGWTLPVVGTLIILSPLPDELGISLMGISQVKTLKFLLISLASHTVGMSLLIFASRVA